MKQRIICLFLDNMLHEFSSKDMHTMFGSSFRTRVSDINKTDALPVIIRNKTARGGTSLYWGELREAM